MGLRVNTREKAIEHLLKPPAIEYVRSLEELTRKDPDYVNANRVDVGNIIRGFLAGSGFLWDTAIFEKEWPAILQEALARVSRTKQ
jgi:hypothetical protein